MKKIINRPETLVIEMCNGIAVTHTDLEFDSKYKIIKKKEINKSKVTLISGGGSGHEPAHAGFVGKGMLDAAVCGDVFASPSQIQVYQAIKKTATEKGTLLIIKNYSGDMMNFKNAAYLAQEDGIQVEYIKVDDDIAVQDSLYTVGRRGVAGTVFVHKIAGAAAEKGMELSEVKRIGQKTVNNVRSIGFALSSCTVPAKGAPTFILNEDEMEYGVGIHGEPGIKREKIVSADVLVKRMIDALVEDLKINGDEEVAVLINGFGGSPMQELYLLSNSVAREINQKKLEINRIFVGNYMTSIDMAGASVSILKLDSELKEFLSDSCDTPAFSVSGGAEAVKYTDLAVESEEAQEVISGIESPVEYSFIKDNHISLENMIYIVDCMSKSVIQNEKEFCALDSHAGDGDFGMSVAKGFKQLKREWKNILEKQSMDIGSFLEACSLVIMEYCGGASGPIWGSAFRGAGKSVGAKTKLSPVEFGKMLGAAVESIQKTGKRSFGRGAEVGDKTLIDALVPCTEAWDLGAESKPVKELFAEGAKAAVEGAESTKKIVARMGRAGTVGERSLGYPDAGAYGLGVIFTDIANALK